MTFGKELPDFDLIRPVGRFGIASAARTLRRDEFQDAQLLDFFRLKRIRFSDGRLTDFLQDYECQHVATIDPFRMPVDDVFSGISDGISALLRLLIPIYQRAGATDVDDFGDKFFRESGQRCPKHVGILDKFRERSADPGFGSGNLKVGSRRKISPTKPSAVRAEALKNEARFL